MQEIQGIQEIIIDEEFKMLLPMLDAETYRLLEENLLEHGCRDALVLWNGILIDGHNRYEICKKHNIPFNTVNKDFATREAVLIWIISTQVSRRNLTQMQLSHFRGILNRADKKIATDRSGKNQYSDEGECHTDTLPPTANRLAEQYRVSPRTIKRDARVAEAIDAIGELSPDAKRKILSGEANISRIALRGLSEASREEIEEIAAAIESGEYEAMKTAEQTSQEQQNPVSVIRAGTRRLNVVIKKGDKPEMKIALRSYIETLEDLYKLL